MITVKKENLANSFLAVTTDHRIKIKESEKRDKYLDLARELKTLEYEADCDSNSNLVFWYDPQRNKKKRGTERQGNKRIRDDIVD